MVTGNLLRVQTTIPEENGWVQFRMAERPPPSTASPVGQRLCVLMKNSILKKFPVFFAHVYPLHSVTHTFDPKCLHVQMHSHQSIHGPRQDT